MFGWIWGELIPRSSPWNVPAKGRESCGQLPVPQEPGCHQDACPDQNWLNLCPFPDPSPVSVGFFRFLRMP